MTKVEKAQLFIYFSPKIHLALVSEVSLEVKVMLRQALNLHNLDIGAL